ncbi:MAG: 2,3-bisphosphoglycerate-independent phosphoglycerate mutase [Gammaproteobacteria bacterium]|nr:2,3-bisphosphoglycerate-independent phosphoglycerate mutase [Gammaproteobacteria bacterium]
MPTTLLVVLDGWGHSEEPRHNAIHAARTPNWDRWWRTAPRTLLSASGTDVGLPAGQMGNSEVGHMHLGAGRVIRQELSRLSLAIADGSFENNGIIRAAIEKSAGNALHVMGLVSPGGVHSHEDHVAAMIELASDAGVTVHLHAFLDGRDTPPRSAAASLARFGSRVASICGRYYAMDRDGRWDRIESAFDMLTRGAAEYRYTDAVSALEAAYAQGETDEFVRPTLVRPRDQPPVWVRDGDVVVFMNFRADRARQLTRAFVDADFHGFRRTVTPALADFVMLTRYADDIDASCAFEAETPANTFGEHVARLGKRQLRIAETEKYAHVTFFFSGGREQPFAGEDRILVPSPRVATYDLKPEMHAREVTRHVIDAINEDSHDAIVCNFANADMVAHTGVFDATVTAIETLDECLGAIASALGKNGGQCLVTSDHGNAERMLDGDQAHTAHTSAPVPLLYVGPRMLRFRSGGTLCDVAPTLLALMGLAQPDEMTGRSLVADEQVRQTA